MKRISIIAALTLSTALTAAASLSPRLVPDTARWVMHLDMAALKASTVGATLFEAGLNGDAERQLASAKALTGIDLREDIDGLTVFGASQTGDDGVMVMTGRFEADRLTGLAQALEGYSTATHGDLTIHSWVDESSGQRQYGVILDGETLMLSQHSERLQQALDVRMGKAAAVGQAGAEGLDLQSIAIPGTLFGIVADLRQLDFSGNPMLAAADGTERIMLHVSESVTDGVSVSAAVERQTPKQATELEKMLRGLLIMGAMQVQQEQPALAELLQAIQIRTAGRSLNLKFRYPADKLAALVRSSLPQTVQD